MLRREDADKRLAQMRIKNWEKGKLEAVGKLPEKLAVVGRALLGRNSDGKAFRNWEAREKAEQDRQAEQEKRQQAESARQLEQQAREKAELAQQKAELDRKAEQEGREKAEVELRVLLQA